jgi:serine/threonine protein kinase/WD40 repeat protein
VRRWQPVDPTNLNRLKHIHTTVFDTQKLKNGQSSVNVSHGEHRLIRQRIGRRAIRKKVLSHEKTNSESLGASRLLKTIRCKHREGPIVVKIFVKPVTMSVAKQIDVLKEQRKTLNVRHVVFYQRLIETDRAAYAIRQYLYSNLYDRISTRPFLLLVEKMWIAYQLLTALADCHERGVCHGDVKMENVMVTTWNWLYLIDFAPFKPTLMPDDNPADFTFYFDTKRSCTIAPERFYSPTDAIDRNAKLTSSMDIFSCACVIAELLLESTFMTFPQLLKYRQGEYDVTQKLKSLDEPISQLLTRMLSLDPQQRPSAREALEFFPSDFQQFHTFAEQVSTTSQTDERIRLASLYTVAGQDTSILLCSIIASTIRSVMYPSTKITALSLLLELSKQMTDAQKLDRVLPYMIGQLHNQQASVRAFALQSLAGLVESVETLTKGDANIFPEYILPALRGFATDLDAHVRATYASCIAPLAEAALRFLEAEESDVHDLHLRDLQELVQEDVIALLIDASPVVKRNLLSDVTRLCIFFGRGRANDVLLSHMITYLNDRDWQLRAAFAESVVGVGMFVGGKSLEEYILPLLMQALTDSEDVVVKVLNALSTLAELGLLSRLQIKDIMQTIKPLLLHPNIWIRFACVDFISSLSRIGVVDREFLIKRVLEDVCPDLWDLSPAALLHCTKPPISRALYDSVFEGDSRAWILDDERVEGDDEKLEVMKSYISKRINSRFGQVAPRDDSSSFYSVKMLGMTPHTVFLTPEMSRNADKEMPKEYTQPLLSQKSLELFPPTIDIGKRVDKTSLSILAKHGRVDLKKWRPEGTLISTFHEHVYPIKRVIASPDDAFFVSAGRDGFKIWDALRLERNVTNRARISVPSPTTDVCFLGDSHSLVVGGEGVYVARVDYLYSGSTSKYNGYEKIGALEFEEVVKVRAFDERVVCVASSHEMMGWDTRANRTTWTLPASPKNGSLSTFCIDKAQNWILSATNRGVFSLWDVRFGICVKEWCHPSLSPVTKLEVYRRSRKLVTASFDNRTSEVSVWDVEGSPKEVYCVIGEKMDDEISKLYGKGLFSIPVPPRELKIGPTKVHKSVYSFLYPSETGSLITVGMDRRIRYWDGLNIEDSYVVSGSFDKPKYSRQMHEEVVFNMEYVTPHLSNVPSGPVKKVDEGYVDLVNHEDCILDVCMLELPYPMLVTGGRDGLLKVWK